MQLNSRLLTEMYRNSLVEITEGKFFSNLPRTNTGGEKNDSMVRSAIDLEWKYLGDYKKNILLIVRYEVIPYLPDEHLNFLTSVLGACKLGLKDIAILNIAHAPSVLHKDIQNKFKSTITILFGLTPEELEMPLNFPEFQVQVFNNCTFLHAPMLKKLEADRILKSKLWVCLRKMFGV